MIGLSILVSVFVGLGFILLVVPGIMIAIALSVAMPSLVIEKIGISASIKRSRQLTKGNRWRIFGLFFIIGVIFWVLMLVIGILFGLSGMATGGLSAYSLIGAPLLGALAALFITAVLAVLQVELRRLREGTGAESLGKVFE
jgi:uncharacterized membrane protein